jgi:glutathione S-transferase
MSTQKPDLVIYGSQVSPFVRKVAAVCLEKETPLEIENVNVFDPPQWFRDISPMKRIPVLRDRSIAEEGVKGTVADSSAICAMIEKKHPEPALYPADPYEHGCAVFLEEYADTTLAMAGGLGIFRPLYFAAIKGQEPDLATARDAWANKLPPVFDYLEASLDGQDFFVGGALSIADIAVATTLMQVSLVAETPLERWPGLAAHLDAMKARASIAGPFAEADAGIRKTLPERFDLT